MPKLQKSNNNKNNNKKYIFLTFDNINYKINRQNLLHILSVLTNENQENITDEEILILIKKFNLNDEFFLSKINEL